MKLFNLIKKELYLQQQLLYSNNIFYKFIRVTSSSMSRQIDQLKVYADPKLKLKFEILNRLGQGCFGTIYKAINRNMKRQVAIKLELSEQSQDQKPRRSNISNQIAILQRLKDIPGVPKLYGAGKWSCGYYMEIQLLSSSLSDEKNKQFSQIQIYSMTSELIQILKKIHQKGIVHQDLKPQNIMRNDKGSLIIIDFGLSALISTQVPEKQVKKRGFIGTPRYASLAAHNGLPQKPKDDIQSLLYVIGVVYLKKAPWFELKGPASKRLQKIYKYKKANSTMWFKQCGPSFLTAYEYLMELRQQQQLDYNYLIELFQLARKKKTMKTVKVRSQNIEQLRQGPRRNSDLVQSKMLKVNVPKINIHLAQNNKKQKSFNNNHFEQISRSHNNFSQVAQDGYMQLIQFLTQKIFRTMEQNEEDSAVVKNSWSKQPEINNVSKYEGLQFKNPFKAG